MAANKTYGLIIPKKGKGKPPAVTRPSIFDDDSDDEQDAFTAVNKSLVSESKKVFTKKQNQLQIEKAMEEDPNIYEYDNIYDEMQEKKVGKIKEMSKTKDKRPKYMQNLLKAAEVRKKDNERRVERQVQKEREEEKGMYDDKESFVTGAYKQKMLEMQQAEEEERRKNAIEDAMDVTKQKDMSGFHRHLLAQMTGEEEVPDNTKPRIKPEPQIKTEPDDKPKPQSNDSAEDGPPKLSELFDDRDDPASSSSDSDSSNSNSEAPVKKRKTENEPRNEGDKRRRRSESPRRRDRDGRRDRSTSNRDRQQRERSRSRDRDRQQRERSRSRDRDSRRDRRDLSRDRKDKRRDVRDRSEERRDRHGRERRDSRDRHRDSKDRRSDRDRDANKRDRRGDRSPRKDTKDTSAKSDSKNSEKKPDKAALKAELDSLREAAKKEKEGATGSMFTKRTTGDDLSDAKARFLARKQARAKPVIEQD